MILETLRTPSIMPLSILIQIDNIVCRSLATSRTPSRTSAWTLSSLVGTTSRRWPVHLFNLQLFHGLVQVIFTQDSFNRFLVFWMKSILTGNWPGGWQSKTWRSNSEGNIVWPFTLILLNSSGYDWAFDWNFVIFAFSQFYPGMLSAQLVGRLLPEIQHSDNIRWDIDKDKGFFCNIQTETRWDMENSYYQISTPWGHGMDYCLKVRSSWSLSVLDRNLLRQCDTEGIKQNALVIKTFCSFPFNV